MKRIWCEFLGKKFRVDIELEPGETVREALTDPERLIIHNVKDLPAPTDISDDGAFDYLMNVFGYKK
jgi:hypothetical protein